MLKKLIPLLLVVMLLTSLGSVLAQEAATSNVTIFVVICDTRAVVNFSGTMQAGFDVYYQVFSGPGGTGNALTTLRQAPVSGTYTYSEIVNYNEGATVPPGGVGSVYVAIARETNAASTIYTTTVDDLQDGCAEPQNPLGASTDTGGSASVPTSTTQSPGTTSAGTSNILSPFGGVVNPNYIPPDPSLVVIGARPEFVEPRQETPGLIFAECNDYPVAVPGVVYDTDSVVIFWSWYARTAEQVQQHIDAVDYSVTFYGRLPLPDPIVRTPIERRGNNYWVFYYARLGSLIPGQYFIEYKVNWNEPITDGYDNFGPGTENVQLISGCGFRIRPNLEGRRVTYNSWPVNFLATFP